MLSEKWCLQTCSKQDCHKPPICKKHNYLWSAVKWRAVRRGTLEAAGLLNVLKHLLPSINMMIPSAAAPPVSAGGRSWSPSLSLSLSLTCHLAHNSQHILDSLSAHDVFLGLHFQCFSFHFQWMPAWSCWFIPVDPSGQWVQLLCFLNIRFTVAECYHICCLELKATWTHHHHRRRQFLPAWHILVPFSADLSPVLPGARPASRALLTWDLQDYPPRPSLQHWHLWRDKLLRRGSVPALFSSLEGRSESLHSCAERVTCMPHSHQRQLLLPADITHACTLFCLSK